MTNKTIDHINLFKIENSIHSERSEDQTKYTKIFSKKKLKNGLYLNEFIKKGFF
jgi:hypothetical protein